MQLNDILKDCLSQNILDQLGLIEVSGLTLDSRQVKKNSLFIALKGKKSDGRAFIPQALENGASAILVDGDFTYPNNNVQNIPIISLVNLSQAVAAIAANYYAKPSSKLRMFGVTGTNGKTSCTHFFAQVLQQYKENCGIIGTLGSGFYDELIETGMTTPDAISLQKILADLLSEGAKAVAMEVSSHSIDQGRANAISFEIGMFTNLTQDHLDYHGTMENYAAVKRSFLSDFPIKNLIINADDDYGQQWIKDLTPQRNIFSYSLQPTKFKTDKTIHCDQISYHDQGIETQVVTPWGNGQLFLPLKGEFNLSNALAVLTALCLYGLSLEQVLTAFRDIKPVMGRMQTFGGGEKPYVVVDYAHTPDALDKILKAIRSHCRGKIICVFGCGGERDASKRPLMAKMAEQYSDQIIITNDNPRHESPEVIIEQILKGFSKPDLVKVEPNRVKAIQKSIQWATPNDYVLIAGKGAERYQQIGDEKFPFDDVAWAKHFLEQKDN